MQIDFDYIEKLAGNNNELMLYIVPLLQQFDDWAEQNREAEALAADRLEMNKELEAAAQKVLRTSLDRLELLKRCKSVIDVCGVDWKHSTSRLDPALFDELEEELGDE